MTWLRWIPFPLVPALLACGGGSSSGTSDTSDGSGTAGSSASATSGSATASGTGMSASGADDTGTGSATTGLDGSSGGTADTGGTTGLECAAVMLCVMECPDEPCAVACFEMGSAQGQQEASALLECDETNACAGDQACLDQNCAEQGAACFTGPLDCSSMLDCVDACVGDHACELACYYDSTSDAQAEFDALLACIERSGCMDDACIERNCATELGACTG